MSFRKTLLAATMLALPLAAQAQPVTGIYVAAGAGVNWWESNSSALPFNPAAIGLTTNNAAISVKTNTGFAGVLSGGWGFGNGLRVEIEGNYRSNNVDGGSFRTVDSNTASQGNINWGRSGYVSTMGVMANLLYDIGSTMGWPVQLTIGGGIGYAWNRWSGVGASAFPGFGDNVRLNGTTGGFAWQGIAGVSVPIRAVPGLYLTAEYRYFSSQGSSINGTYQYNSITNTLNPNQFRTSIDPDNNNQSVLVGVRYNFGRAPAPVPMAVAPAPARSFLVFFDFASDQLTARAREIVGQAAQAARTQQVTRIEVAGHTDTVGSAQYNQGLSIRRANNVAAELVRQGVPRQAITTAGFGFSRPLVPTGPNVREPQNRRVEIVLR